MIFVPPPSGKPRYGRAEGNNAAVMNPSNGGNEKVTRVVASANKSRRKRRRHAPEDARGGGNRALPSTRLTLPMIVIGSTARSEGINYPCGFPNPSLPKQGLDEDESGRIPGCIAEGKGILRALGGFGIIFNKLFRKTIQQGRKRTFAGRRRRSCRSSSRLIPRDPRELTRLSLRSSS